jgi:hypothetical protein
MTSVLLAANVSALILNVSEITLLLAFLRQLLRFVRHVLAVLPWPIVIRRPPAWQNQVALD